jgi:hypothetical protein
MAENRENNQHLVYYLRFPFRVYGDAIIFYRNVTNIMQMHSFLEIVRLINRIFNHCLLPF